jgi:predicted TIM-barrel fold metal-dependent hydrolase
MSIRPICPVYELANQYAWVLLFHTGIVLRRSVDQAENVASYRMRAFHLEEIAGRFPKLTVIGAHCGNPDYEWAAEVARWNPNVFFDLSGSTLTKMSARLEEFKKFFWCGLDGIEHVASQYLSLFKSCDVS